MTLQEQIENNNLIFAKELKDIMPSLISGSFPREDYYPINHPVYKRGDILRSGTLVFKVLDILNAPNCRTGIAIILVFIYRYRPHYIWLDKGFLDDL